MALTIEARDERGVPLLALTGQLTLGDETNQYRDKVFQLVNAGQKRLIVDLNLVERIDSCGIGVLVEMMVYTVKQGGQMKLIRLSRRVNNALVVHRLVQAFEIYGTADAALASFNSTAPA